MAADYSNMMKEYKGIEPEIYCYMVEIPSLRKRSKDQTSYVEDVSFILASSIGSPFKQKFSFQC